MHTELENSKIWRDVSVERVSAKHRRNAARRREAERRRAKAAREAREYN